jgi:alkanesulfonate monooxygenase SsuD/methylene tetrahydromethanopterin reductase-like flavin-dependent oxidoreductase (luciferase family)
MNDDVHLRREGRLRLGFLTNVPFTSDAGGARRGLEEAIATFEYAESIGFDTGWVRQRHFDNYLASPITLLAAVSQRTERIRLGTGIVSIRYEDPIRFAEDASTADLLSDGRLELGLAGGMPGFEAVFGALIGLDLLQSTLNLNPTADTFEKAQRNTIEAYLDAWERPRHPRVCVSRLFMPAVNQRQRELYAAFDAIRQAEGPAGPRPAGAQEPGMFQRTLRREQDQLRNVQLCPIYHGDPDYVLERAQADDALQLADELMIWLPPNFTLAENKELLDNIVEFIAPELGWHPADAAVSAA